MNHPRSALPAPLPASVLAEGTDRYDVVVIGFGIAGGCAALEAARAGVRVLVGAGLKHMGEPFITAPFYPPSVLITGLIVNSRGTEKRAHSPTRT